MVVCSLVRVVRSLILTVLDCSNFTRASFMFLLVLDAIIMLNCHGLVSSSVRLVRVAVVKQGVCLSAFFVYLRERALGLRP